MVEKVEEKEVTWIDSLSKEDRERVRQLRIRQREEWGLGDRIVAGWDSEQGFTDEQKARLESQSNI